MKISENRTRPRALLRALTLALACAAGAMGCQIVAGLTVLEITGGTGGQGGAGGGGTSTATGTGGDEASTGMSSSSGPDCQVCPINHPCHLNNECETGYCALTNGTMGFCQDVKALGKGCTVDDECGSTHCTDGVCCKLAACSNECLSCAASDDGTCQPKVGAPCGDHSDSECTDPDTCSDQGVCQANHTAMGTTCGDAATECSGQDTCNGSGTCVPNHIASGMACGDPTDNDCTDPDTCDGAGACNRHDMPLDTVCGGTCMADMLLPAGKCNSTGVCSSQVASLCPGFNGCNSNGKTCNTTCTTSADCSATGLCVNPAMPACVACGTVPPMSSCTVNTNCETCDGANTCITTCDSANECAASRPITVDMGPGKLDCGSQCNNITVQCQGPFGCEVVCGDGGCKNLIMNCGPDGPCKLTCTGTGCVGAKMNCGENGCNAVCTGGSPVINQMCNSSCGCTKTGCQ